MNNIQVQFQQVMVLQVMMAALVVSMVVVVVLLLVSFSVGEVLME